MRPQLVAIVQYDALRATILDVHPGDRRVAPDLGAKAVSRGGDRFADGPDPSLGESPGPEDAVQLAHIMMKEHVGGAGRAWTKERADDPARRLRRLEDVRLEPLIQKVRRAHRHQLDERVQPLAAE